MRTRILITGGSGSIGSALRTMLLRQGIETSVLDLRATGDSHADVRNARDMDRTLADCSGVIHLAAVSRVVWAEQNPERCFSINVDGTRTVLSAALNAAHKPWVLFASSREVYGEPETLPVCEDAPIRPVNVYGSSKAEAEKLVAQATRNGLRASIVRLSNVYGSAEDHTDRVVPSFVRAALSGAPLDVAGPQRVFDFTYIDDTLRGLCLLVDMLSSGRTPPPLHLATGEGVSLDELARTVVDATGSQSVLRERPVQSYDVSSFVGAPERAQRILGWAPETRLRDGLVRMLKQTTAFAHARPSEARAS